MAGTIINELYRSTEHARVCAAVKHFHKDFTAAFKSQKYDVSAN